MVIGVNCYSTFPNGVCCSKAYFNAQFLSMQSTPTVLSGQRQDRPPGVAKQR